MHECAAVSFFPPTPASRLTVTPQSPPTTIHIFQAESPYEEDTEAEIAAMNAAAAAATGADVASMDFEVCKSFVFNCCRDGSMLCSHPSRLLKYTHTPTHHHTQHNRTIFSIPHTNINIHTTAHHRNRTHAFFHKWTHQPTHQQHTHTLYTPQKIRTRRRAWMCAW